MNYVIYGEETLLMDQKLASLKKQYHIQEEDMNMVVYWCQETSIQDMIEDALTPPFLTEYKMIVMKNPLFLTTQKQKDVQDEDIERLMRYLSVENPTTIFVIYHDCKNFDERKKIVKFLRKNTEFMIVDRLNDQELFKATHQSIKSRGCTIDDDALQLLLLRAPEGLLNMSQEVNKLCLYKQHIDRASVEKMVPKKIEENVFELTKAILEKDTKKNMQIYKDLMMKNEEPIKLIVLIAASLRSLYQVKLLDRKGYNDHEIAKILGMNPYRLKYIRQDGQSYDIQELLKMIDELAKLDISIKTGKIDRFKGLELFLMRVGG